MAKKTLFRLEFETDFRVVGVFCPEKDYRFCWLLNNKLDFNFRRATDFTDITGKSESAELHSVYLYERESLQRTYFLVNNRSNEGSRLFSNPAGLDFLLLVKADDSRFNYNQLLKKIRALPQVTAAYMLDDALGKNKDAFLYDFEVYLSQELKM
ncbi:MAG: IPExxxVDY family protein [Bacteroidales bacterium]